ncbi:MAG: anion transporter [Ignavibacterium sp.]|nr:anion transporter [Ignavibacterium sp.]MDW8376077.1 anion transporter [Ignavibacteriales bacterium]
MLEYINLLIIILSLFGIAIGSFPKFRMNRATISLVGATVLIILNQMSLEKAVSFIDIDTIVLIFAMMIININLRLAGFFNIITNKVIAYAKTPKQLLVIITFSSGILSSLFLNDTIVIMFTPMIIEIALHLRRNPIPYLIALATSANIGSAATIVGNPQNMIIGVQSGISFSKFIFYMFPISVICLLLVIVVISFFYKNEFGDERFNETLNSEPRIYKPLFFKSTIVLFFMLIAFLVGLPVAPTALAASAILLITRRIKPERVFLEIDFSLLIFFSCLFIISHLTNQMLISKVEISDLKFFSENRIINISIIASILSNLISNVPAVLMLSPLVKQMIDPEKVWLALALSSTFAGNLTLLGSVANLIVVEISRKRNINVRFLEYLKSGVVITLLSLIIGVLWLIII